MSDTIKRQGVFPYRCRSVWHVIIRTRRCTAQLMCSSATRKDAKSAGLEIYYSQRELDAKRLPVCRRNRRSVCRRNGVDKRAHRRATKCHSA